MREETKQKIREAMNEQEVRNKVFAEQHRAEAIINHIKEYSAIEHLPEE